MRRFGGTWSESKLDCVERYLAAYLRVMQNQPWYVLHYVDAFAGPGKQTLKTPSAGATEAAEVRSFFGDESERTDSEEFLVGSAIRALTASSKSTRPFDKFVFIDADQPSCRELDSVVSSKFARLQDKVGISCDDANSALDEYLATTDWANTLAVVFLDPYGLEVSWETIGHIAATGACDVWYLFPLGGVIRMMTNNGQIPDAWRARLNQVLGTPDWFGEFYHPFGQQSLIDDAQGSQFKDASTRHVVQYVRHRLQVVFPAVSNAGILRNRKGAPLFALVLGVSSRSKSAQQAALRIANHIVKGLDRK